MLENELTPIEKHGNLFIKREDYFKIGDMCGAKLRACYILSKQAKELGYKTITTLGAKSSPQINLATTVGNELGLNVVGHTTTAPLEKDMLLAKQKGATIIQHSYGYTSVLIKRTKDYAKENNAFYIPFGMDDIVSINATKEQVKSINPYKNEIKRIVVPLGSGINLCGIILGLKEMKIDIPVVGVQIGFKPDKILEKYLGKNWQQMFTKVNALQDYNKSAKYTIINGVEVDSTYEGKCIPFLQEGDLFWLVGKKSNYKKGKEMVI